MIMIFLLTLRYEIWQHLEGLYNLVNQYFPNGQCKLSHNCVWMKESSKMPAGLVGFNTRGYAEFTDMISDSVLSVCFQELFFSVF